MVPGNFYHLTYAYLCHLMKINRGGAYFWPIDLINNCQIFFPANPTISNSNWTEWSTIQGVIGRVISNRPSAKREADLKLRAQLLPELYDTKSNY